MVITQCYNLKYKSVLTSASDICQRLPTDSVTLDSFLRHGNRMESRHSCHAKLAIDSCRRINVTRACDSFYCSNPCAKVILGNAILFLHDWRESSKLFLCRLPYRERGNRACGAVEGKLCAKETKFLFSCDLIKSRIN